MQGQSVRCRTTHRRDRVRACGWCWGIEYTDISLCLFVCLFVCLSVCLSLPSPPCYSLVPPSRRRTENTNARSRMDGRTHAYLGALLGENLLATEMVEELTAVHVVHDKDKQVLGLERRVQACQHGAGEHTRCLRALPHTYMHIFSLTHTLKDKQGSGLELRVRACQHKNGDYTPCLRASPHTNTHRHTLTDKQTDRQTHTHTPNPPLAQLTHTHTPNLSRKGVLCFGAQCSPSTCA